MVLVRDRRAISRKTKKSMSDLETLIGGGGELDSLFQGGRKCTEEVAKDAGGVECEIPGSGGGPPGSQQK